MIDAVTPVSSPVIAVVLPVKVFNAIPVKLAKTNDSVVGIKSNSSLVVTVNIPVH